MNKIIREENVEIDAIQHTLQESGFDTKKDRGDSLYIRDAFTFGAWCCVQPGPRWLNWTTYWDLRSCADESKAIELAHCCSKNAPMLAFYVEHARLYASACQFYAGGISARSVCRMAKTFPAIFEKTAREFDVHGILLVGDLQESPVLH